MNHRVLGFQILSDDDKAKVHESALDVLNAVGVEIKHPQVLELLVSAGAVVADNHAVQIPRRLVKKALEDCPARIKIYSRQGKESAYLSDNYYCMLASLHVVNLVDEQSGSRRPITYNDACDYSAFMNDLEHLEIVGGWTISDRPSQIADRYSAHAHISNSEKPFYLAPLSMDGMVDVYKMCVAVVGNEKSIESKPFWITAATCIPPFRFPDLSLERLLFATEKGVPIVIAPVEMAGASSPIDLFGTLVMLVANNLAGLVIGQLNRPGAPMIMGGVGAAMDMLTGQMNYAGPEFSLLCGGLAEMGRYFKLPVWGTGGCTSSKLFDSQAAAEITSSMIFAVLSGGHLIHDVGFLDNGLATSYETLVFCNEIASFTKKFGRGIACDNSGPVIDQIKKAGVTGEYLTSEETLKNFRHLWNSKLMERRGFEKWEKEGKVNLNQRLSIRAGQILENLKPTPLSKERQKSIDDILEKCGVDSSKHNKVDPVSNTSRAGVS